MTPTVEQGRPCCVILANTRYRRTTPGLDLRQRHGIFTPPLRPSGGLSNEKWRFNSPGYSSMNVKNTHSHLVQKQSARSSNFTPLYGVEWSFSTTHFNMAILAVTAVASTVAKTQAELSGLNLKPKFVLTYFNNQLNAQILLFYNNMYVTL